MAFFRGEEGSVAFDNGTGSTGAVASTTAWTLRYNKRHIRDYFSWCNIKKFCR